MQENKQPDMVYNGQLTEAGRDLVAFLENQCKAADEQRTVQLSGHIGYYYVNVYKNHAMTAERYMEDYKKSYVAAAWQDMVFLKENAAVAEKQAQAIEQTNDIAAKLEALMSQMAEMSGEIATLKAKPEPKKRKTTAQTEPLADPELVAEPVEPDELPEDETGEADASEEA